MIATCVSKRYHGTPSQREIWIRILPQGAAIGDNRGIFDQYFVRKYSEQSKQNIEWIRMAWTHNHQLKFPTFVWFSNMFKVNMTHFASSLQLKNSPPIELWHPWHFDVWLPLPSLWQPRQNQQQANLCKPDQVCHDWTFGFDAMRGKFPNTSKHIWDIWDPIYIYICMYIYRPIYMIKQLWSANTALWETT